MACIIWHFARARSTFGGSCRSGTFPQFVYILRDEAEIYHSYFLYNHFGVNQLWEDNDFMYFLVNGNNCRPNLNKILHNNEVSSFLPRVDHKF
jgi:hypothetical protein